MIDKITYCVNWALDFGRRFFHADLYFKRIVKENEETNNIKVTDEMGMEGVPTISASCKSMSARERRELVERVQAMSPEELAIVVDVIPVEMCLAKVTSEIQRLKGTEKALYDIVRGKIE